MTGTSPRHLSIGIITQSGNEQYPTTTGISNKIISDILIYSDDAAPVIDTIYDGTVTLIPGETFTKMPTTMLPELYTINRTTPLGALDKVASLQGFTYDVTDKRWSV